jgi:hypothetical protein
MAYIHWVVKHYLLGSMNVWGHTYTITPTTVYPDLGDLLGEILGDVSGQIISLGNVWGHITIQTAASHFHIIYM